MAFFYAAMLVVCLIAADPSWLLYLSVGAALMQVLSLGAASGAYRVAGLCVDEVERRSVVSSALLIWLAVGILVAGLNAALAFLSMEWGLFSWYDPRHLLAAPGGVFFALMALGRAACMLRGRRAARVVLWALCAACIVCAMFFPGAQLIIAGAGIGACAVGMWCAAWIKPGKIDRENVRAVAAKGRPDWIRWALYGLPGAVLCFFVEGLLPAYLAGMVLLTGTEASRRDAVESERVLAALSVGTMLSLGLAIWLTPVLGLAPGAGGMPLWAAVVLMIPALSGRSVRYGYLVAGLLGVSVLAGVVLPDPWGAMVALLPMGLAVWLLRRFLYAALLPLRARMRRRR